MLKLCPKCNVEFDPGKWNKKYCSRTCANTRLLTPEVREKIRQSLKGKTHPSHRNVEKWKESIRRSREEKYRNSSFEELGMENKRRRVFEEQGFSCAGCGLNEWRGKPIVLELEHKDGNHQNNCRENLEGLCPNCHSLTDTWRGRNKEGSLQGKISDDELISILKNSKNIREGLISAGLAAKGGNYKRAKRLWEQAHNFG